MNDLTPFDGGGLAPYSPSQPLAPAPDFGTTDVDLLRDGYSQPTTGRQTVLGQLLPAGVDVNQMMAGYKQLGDIFAQDFMKLGHNVSQTQKAVKWFMAALTNPPAQQQQRHRYNLYEHSSDPIFQAFANYAHDNGFSAKFVSDAAWWVTEASKRLNAQQPSSHVSHVQPRTAPHSSNPLGSLTDAEYEQVVAANDAARAVTMGYLQNIWGSSFDANLRMVDNYFKSLPLREQQALDKMTTGWISSLNTKEAILHLYKQALQESGGPLPSGGALADQIQAYEKRMRTDRHAWLRDEVGQSRYRELIRIRDGG